MLITTNRKAKNKSFEILMDNVTKYLNEDAKLNGKYYRDNGDTKLEPIIKQVIEEKAKGTEFENTIQLVSGKHFPDIVANKYYGVEVKSNKKSWKSTGSSILETTRVDGVERIYITFGKLSHPVEFLTRRYEEVMDEIVVTHMPRYKINMELTNGRTIFDKMGVSYEALRHMDDPTKIVADYYKSQLKPGESLWQAGSNLDNISSITLKLFKTLDIKEKERLRTEAMILFPEIFSQSSPTKYDRLSLWLVIEHSVVNNNVRDLFSAGGQYEYDGKMYPASFGRIANYKKEIKKLINELDVETLKYYWNVKSITDSERIEKWIELVLKATEVTLDKKDARRFLKENLK